MNRNFNRLLCGAAFAMAMLATPALATTTGNNGGGNGGCGVGQTTNGCGGVTTPDTVIIGIGGAGGAGGNVTVGDTTLTNQQAQLQGQFQAQAQTIGNTTATASGGNSNATGGSVLASGNSAILGSGNSDVDVRNTANGGNATGGSLFASGNSNNDIRNTNTANGGAGGNATGGSATGGNASTGAITNVNSTGPSVSSATGGRVGDITTGAATSSSNNANNANNSANNSSNNSSSNEASGNTSTVTVEGDTYIHQARRIPVSTAYAAPLAASAPCLGSLSGGAQTGVFGISLGGTKKDRTCEIINLGREAGNMQMPDVQCEILSEDRRFAAALRRANRTCALPTATVVVPVAPVPAPATNSNMDEADIRRAGERG
jgi:hypothetical protein